MPNTVSLIVVNYNGGAFLNACIASAIDQVDEAVVVDNASSDSSLQELDGVFRAEEKLRVVRNGKNLGFSAACNIGVDRTHGTYLLFLNPDCVLEPGAIGHLVKTLERIPDAGMVGGLLVGPDGAEQGGGRRAVPTPWRSFVRAFGLAKFSDRWPRLFFDFHLHKQPLPSKPIEVEAISGACMLVRRSAMRDVGRWDEGYFLHCEDLDFSMSLRRKGWKILFVPDARIVHHKGGCSQCRPIFVEWHKHLGMMRFYRKFFRKQYPGLLMWLVVIGVWIRFLGRAAYHTGHLLEHKMGWLRE
ncbi:MAG: glycosyltransferase family 2 protein [Gammaproteobacteria bacterium]